MIDGGTEVEISLLYDHGREPEESDAEAAGLNHAAVWPVLAGENNVDSLDPTREAAKCEVGAALDVGVECAVNVNPASGGVNLRARAPCLGHFLDMKLPLGVDSFHSMF
jgi:hypothetical protein